MIEKVTLSDIPSEIKKDKERKNFLMEEYGVSRVTAWRLITGRVSHICPGYHSVKMDIATNGKDLITSEVITYMQNCIIRQLELKWNITDFSCYLEDITKKCIIRAYEKSGVWADFERSRKRAYLSSIAKYTTNDYIKSEKNKRKL